MTGYGSIKTVFQEDAKRMEQDANWQVPTRLLSFLAYERTEDESEGTYRTRSDDKTDLNIDKQWNKEISVFDIHITIRMLRLVLKSP